jgi:hypothetical protein
VREIVNRGSGTSRLSSGVTRMATSPDMVEDYAMVVPSTYCVPVFPFDSFPFLTPSGRAARVTTPFVTLSCDYVPPANPRIRVWKLISTSTHKIQPIARVRLLSVRYSSRTGNCMSYVVRSEDVERC